MTRSPLRHFPPALFAPAMATGIVSVAAQLTGRPAVARALLAVNVPLFIALWLAALARVALHRDLVLADLRDQTRAAGVFSAAAATAVLGAQCLVVGASPGVATVLWGAALALWAGLTYGVFTALIVAPEKPPPGEGLHGAWLLAVVAAQSVASLGAQVAPGLAAHRVEALLVSFALWSSGSVLYLWIAGALLHRLLFLRVSAAQLTPPYWICMGAAAVSTLAGASLSAAAPAAPFLASMLPFVRGLTALWWATATWWVPLLLALGAWRHLGKRHPLRYDAQAWGAVFPLGMYAACTARLAHLLDVPSLDAVARAASLVALGAWAATSLGALASVRAPASE